MKIFDEHGNEVFVTLTSTSRGSPIALSIQDEDHRMLQVLWDVDKGFLPGWNEAPE